MTRNYDIAEFRETDDLSPTTTRKLNNNFLSLLKVIRDLSVGGADTAAIANYVIDALSGDLDSLDARIDALEAAGAGSGSLVAGTKVPWTGSSYDENQFYDEDSHMNVALHNFSGHKTFEELGLEPLDTIDDINQLFPITQQGESNG